MTFEYDDESDHVGYPIPPSPLIEGGPGPVAIATSSWSTRTAAGCYELFAAASVDGAWHAGSGATWNLRSNALRPAGWTSADAAGLPILPGLVRYDEVAAGVIRHALRFTTNRTRQAYIYPARHQAGESTSTSLPPMGLRVRLKARYDTSGLSPHARIIATALKRYGMILADNGSPWYISGMSDPRFDDDVLHELDDITGPRPRGRQHERAASTRPRRQAPPAGASPSARPDRPRPPAASPVPAPRSARRGLRDHDRHDDQSRADQLDRRQGLVQEDPARITMINGSTVAVSAARAAPIRRAPA